MQNQSNCEITFDTQLKIALIKLSFRSFSFYSQPRTKQKYGSINENEGLSGMLKLCTAVMRHDPSFKMSPAGLVSDLWSPLSC